MTDDRLDGALRFRTGGGSRVRVFGRHLGSYEVDFDWFGEGACIEAAPSVDIDDKSDPWLRWQCDCCESGQARLIELPHAAP